MITLKDAYEQGLVSIGDYIEVPVNCSRREGYIKKNYPEKITPEGLIVGIFDDPVFFIGYFTDKFIWVDQPSEDLL